MRAVKYDRLNKNEVRHLMFRDLGPKQSILTMPADGALCCLTMEQHGVISKDTPQQWVERRPRIFNGFVALQSRLGYTNVTSTMGELEDYLPVTPIDLLNADLESSFTERFGIMLETTLATKLLDNASIVLWLTGLARNPTINDFHQWLVQRCREPGVFRDLADHCSAHLNTNVHSIVIPLVLLNCALRGFRFNYAVSKEYSDTFEMVAIRVDNVRRMARPNEEVPSFSSVVADFRSQFDRTFNRRSFDQVNQLRAHLARHGRSLVHEDGMWYIVDAGKRLIGAPIEPLFEMHQPYMVN